MKNTFFLFVLIAVLSAFTAINYDVRNSTAEVNQHQGLYVFVDSKPVKEYQYLGTVKITIGMSGQYQPLRDALIKKARKEYPQANGLIINFVNGGTDKADAILFKE